MRERHDTVIVGAGQAGLVMSHFLRQRGREHVLLERRRIAERWRTERWDSLHFQFPNSWLRLPGKPYGGSDPGSFAHHPDVLRFILDYAAEIAAPVRIGVDVLRLEADPAGGYLLNTNEGDLAARHLVLATGPFQRPVRPEFSAGIPPSVHQLDATYYRNPAKLPEGAVLVVGSGNSGCQIADELLRSGRRVLLSLGRHTRVPRRYRGKDVIWWYETLGRFDVDVASLPSGRYPPTTMMTGVDGGYDLSPRGLGEAGVRLVGRLTGADGFTLHVADDAQDILAAADRSCRAFRLAADAHVAAPGAEDDIGDAPEPVEDPAPVFDACRTLDLRAEKIGTIIWASGYGFELDWVKLPVLDGAGVPVQRRGVTACPGLYFLGLHWMYTFRSAILPFIEADAAYVADHIDRHLQ